MSKFIATLGFTANVEIEAPDEDKAKAMAEAMLCARSVYEDDKIDVMHDEAYCAGGTGDDPPLRRKMAYQLRDEDFTPDEIEINLKNGA